WFFLMISEAFRLGDDDFRLPGLGSYMSVAVEQGKTGPMIWAVLAMVAMIVALDQLLWRPVVVWAQKFRFEEGGQQQAMSSWFLELLRRSRLLTVPGLLSGWLARRREARAAPPKVRAAADPAARSALVSYLAFG